MALPDVPVEKLREALRRFDTEFRSSPEYAGWETNLAHKYAIETEEKHYPVKKIISLAADVPTRSFSGGPVANEYVTRHGFPVVELHANAIHDSLETILAQYVSARTTEPFSSQALIARTFDRCRRLLSSVDVMDRYPTVKVKASYGQGNWAKVPWIAFLDSRETESTQRGIYPVILFRQDCSGLYVTFNQGVTEPQERMGTNAGLEELRTKAKVIRSRPVGEMLATAGYQLDDGIDLTADAGLGRDYEASTVAYKFYAKDNIPSDADIIRDVEAVLDAYATYLESPVSSPDAPVLHLLLKWSAEQTPDTIERHKRIAEKKGAVWWGKFGEIGVGEARLTQIRNQLAAGRLTKVFLKAGGSLWETTLKDITQNKEAVDTDRLPAYYTVQQCRLFVLLTDFRPVTTDWFIANAVLDSNPEPGSAQTALSSQANPAYIRLKSELAAEPPICLIGTVKTPDEWVARARATIARKGAWASWWSFPVKQEARSRLTKPFVLYVNTGGGTFPLKLLVSEYVTSTGSTGMSSPWPDITDPDAVSKTRSGDTNDLIFKTWFKVSAIESIDPPLRLDAFKPVPGLSTAGNLLNPMTFGYALEAPHKGVSMDALVEQTLLDRSVLDEIVAALRGTQRQVVLAGPPGTSKTFIAQCIAEYLCKGNMDRCRLVQFHPSYSYESFIEGLRPVTRQGGISFELEDGIVLELVKRMKAVGHFGVEAPDYFILIDEMNRANLPRVFGELMYLFEYRDKPMRLQYSDEPFSLPPNIGFLGTMNTADRSIRSIDSALRRRFDVFEFSPSRTTLERYFKREPLNIPNLFDGFEALNAELEAALDRHHTIGHAFFMKAGLDRRQLGAIWARKIYPLIEEYFFDQPDVARGFTVSRFWPDVVP